MTRGPKPQPLFLAARVLGAPKGTSERISLGSRARPGNYFSALAEPEPFAFAPSILAGGAAPPLHAATTATASSFSAGANALDFSALARELSASKEASSTPAAPTIAWDFSAFKATASGVGAGTGE